MTITLPCLALSVRPGTLQNFEDDVLYNEKLNMHEDSGECFASQNPLEK